MPARNRKRHGTTIWFHCKCGARYYYTKTGKRKYSKDEPCKCKVKIR